MSATSQKRKTRLKASGISTLVIIALAQLAAWNTGTNLLYLIVAAMVSTLLLGWWLGRGSLKGLVVSRDTPVSVHRGSGFATTVRIEKTKGIFPTLSLRVYASVLSESAYGYVYKIPAGSTASVRISETIHKRGVYPLPPIVIRSAFPFGFFDQTSVVESDGDLIVLPRVSSLRTGALDEMQGSGETPRLREGDGDEFFSLREYIPGDDMRRIVWRVSARMGHLVVRELEPSTSHSVYIAFDTRGLPEMEDFEEQFEDAVDLVASLAVSFLNRQYTVAVITPETTTELGEGQSQARLLLHFLAGVNPAKAHEHDDQWWEQVERSRKAGYLYISVDPARWGERGRVPGGRILDPREVLRA